MKLLLKPALTVKWPSRKGLDAHLNRAARGFRRDKILPIPCARARIMSNPVPKATQYRFGQFELDPAQSRLSRNGAAVKLQDLPFRLLVLLVERPGEIVSRDDVRQRLWPQDTFVEFDNSLGVAVRKLRDALRDDADAPRFVETVPRKGYRFVAPVTVQDASRPPDIASPTEKAPAAVPAPGATAAAPPSSWHGRYWIITALVLLIVGAAIYELRPAARSSSSTAEAGSTDRPVRVRRAVAVLGFRNLPGRPEDDWLSTAFSEMLSTELAAGGGLRMVSGEDVARAKRELPLAEEDTLAKATLERLHAKAGADVVVLGSYTLLPGKGENRIRLDLRLQDTAAGETISEEALTGNETNLFELASQAGFHLRQSLGMSSISTDASSAARASLPSNQQAVRFYTEGQARLWAFDFVGARDLLLKAEAADPQYPLVHAALSKTWGHLGYSAKARAEAQQALDLSGHLSEEERLLIEGQYQETYANWPKAVEVYRSLFKLFPDSLDYGLRLASVQRRVKPADALTTLATLRRLPAPAGDDPRIDMTEASTWVNQDFVKARAAAQRAIEKGTAQGSHLLVARTYGILCQVASAAGSPAEMIRDCMSAQQSYAVAGDRNNEARTINDLAGVYFQQGDLTRAQTMWKQAAQEFRQVGDREGAAATSNNLGDVLLLQGNLPEARRLLEEALPDYQAIEDKDGLARVLNDLGDLSRQKGELEAAETTYQQAKATAQEIDDKSVVAYVLSGMGDVLIDRGDLAAAHKSYEESLALHNQAGDKQNASETQVALAHLAIEEGHPADAESAMLKCKDQFDKEQQADDELTASVVLTQALLAEGRHADAQKAVDAARPLANQSQNRLARLQFDLAVARVLLTSDQPEASRVQLAKILKDAHAHGFAGIEFEARLALAELEKKSGHDAASRTELTALESSARSKGFGLMARKAAANR
jgi:DNA-binding winged helix-turn-helix (wHTH) protein/tetratricopeptide (TPR) repeat protein